MGNIQNDYKTYHKIKEIRLFSENYGDGGKIELLKWVQYLARMQEQGIYDIEKILDAYAESKDYLDTTKINLTYSHTDDFLRAMWYYGIEKIQTSDLAQALLLVNTWQIYIDLRSLDDLGNAPIILHITK